MDIVSFETAAKLKNAGFLQPKPEFGQFWYNYEGECRSIGFVSNGNAYSAHEKFKAVQMRPFRGFSEMLFAPAATDILREIDARVFIGCDTFDTWTVVEFRNGEIERYLSQHENSAEAAALAWMYLQSRKSA